MFTAPSRVGFSPIQLEVANLTICVVTNSRLKRAKLSQTFAKETVTLVESTSISEVMALAETITPVVFFIGYDSYSPFHFMVPPPPGAHFILMGSALELSGIGPPFGKMNKLEVPFLPECALLKINELLAPQIDRQQQQCQMDKKLRRFKRCSVEGVSVEMVKPLNTRAKVVKLSPGGFKAEVQGWDNSFVNRVFQLRLFYDGISVALEARLVWVHGKMVSFCFGEKRVPALERFLDKALAS